MSENEVTPRYKVQVLDRALGLLNELANGPSEPTLVELSERVQLHKSTVHRLLAVLEQHRFVEKTSNGRYRLGLRLFELGSRAVEDLDLRSLARPHLEKLAYEASETTNLCALNEGEVLYLDKVEPSRSVRMACTVGRRMPAHCTGVGKLMLAFRPECEVDAILQRFGMRSLTPNTITTPAALRTELEIIRRQGFALDCEENEQGVNCIAAPVRAFSGQVIASISLSGPAFRVNETTIETLTSAVVAAASALSADLGYQVPQTRGVLSAV